MDGRTVSRRRFLRLAGLVGGSTALMGWTNWRANAQEGPIKLGWVGPLTGGLGAPNYGNDIANSAKLAVEDLNNEGGVLGREVQLLVEDTQLKADVAVEKVRKLIENDKIAAFGGTLSSSVGLALLPTAENFKTLFLNTHTMASQATGVNCNRYHFRFNPDTVMHGGLAGRYAVENLGKRVFLIDPGYSYGDSMRLAASEAVAKAGGEVVGTRSVAFPVQDDFSAEIAAVQATQPDAIISSMWGTQQVNFLRQRVEFGIDGIPFISGAAGDIVEARAAEKDVLGVTDVIMYYWDLGPFDSRKNRSFVNRYVDAFGILPIQTSAIVYDAILVWAAAATDVGSVVPDDVIPALEGRTYQSFYGGQIEMRAGDHQALAPVFIGQYNSFNVEENIPFLDVLQRVPGSQTARPVDQTGCTM